MKEPDPAITLTAARALYGHARRFARCDNPRSKRVGEDLAAVSTATELAVEYPRLAARNVVVALGLARAAMLTHHADTPIGHAIRVCAAYLEWRTK